MAQTFDFEFTLSHHQTIGAADIRLFVDRNRDGDLRDDKALKMKQAPDLALRWTIAVEVTGDPKVPVGFVFQFLADPEATWSMVVKEGDRVAYDQKNRKVGENFRRVLGWVR